MTGALLVGSIIAVGGFLAGGYISDRIGRRAAFVRFGLLLAVVGTLLTVYIVGLSNTSVPAIYLGFSIMFGLVGLVWGSGPHSYLNERFHTGSRSSGYGIVFSFSIILPSFYGFYQNWLGKVMSASQTPAALLLIGSIIVVVAAAIGPETQTLRYIDE